MQKLQITGLQSSSKVRSALPDGLIRRRWSTASAVAEVDGHLRSIDPAIQPLPAAVLAAHGAVAGWPINLTDGSGYERKVRLVVDRQFPRTMPSVYLVNPPKFGAWPHLETSGKLCLWADGTVPPAGSTPSGLGDQALHAAWSLISDSVSGANVDDFRAEFLSYWKSTPGAQPVKSLLAASGPTRFVKASARSGLILVADSQEDLDSWLTHAMGKATTADTIPALLVWLPEPLIPAEYPFTTTALLALVEAAAPDEAGMITEAASRNPSAICVILGSQSINGPCLAAITLAPGKSTKARSHGFRKGKVPPDIVRTQWLGSSSLERRAVTRIDAAWIHGRGYDPGFTAVRAATALLIGCGSVGSRVAVDLAAAGVANIILIDPDLMNAPNAGRHVLGINSLGRPKATAVAELLRRRFPQITSVRPFDDSWEDVQEKNPDLLASCDVIVSATGEWASEAALNDWHLAIGRRQPIIYAWTEPYAAAGHAVCIGPSGGCLECGFDAGGYPLLEVTRWPAGGDVLPEPACGGSFSPYGPIELGYITNLASEMALEAVLDPTTPSRQRVWAARAARLRAAGGQWTDEWLAGRPGREVGGFIEDLPWPGAPCPACAGGSVT